MRERKKEDNKKIKKLAKLIVEYCCDVRKDDNVIIITGLPAKPLILELYKEIIKKGAYPRIEWDIEGFSPIYYQYASKEQLLHYPKIVEYIYKNMDVFMFIRAPIKRDECKNCDINKIAIRQKIIRKIKHIYLKKRYVIFDWPTKTLAKAAKMKPSEYRKFVFSACLQNWEKERKKMLKIKELLNKTDKVRIIGDDTDLTFSIKSKNAIVNYGPDNLPGGEVFTAINEKTANGFIRFTYPLRYFDRKISNIKLWFKNGRVVKAESNNMKALNTLLNTDKGARYIGEFGIGCNKKINIFSDNLLFDEKINGTIHLALGMAYPECGGKNKSAIHADIVKDMKKGKMFFDNKLVYKNGRFIF